MRFLWVILVVAFPALAFADLDRAIDAYNADDLATAEAEAAKALEGNLGNEDRIIAQEILLSSMYHAGKSYPDMRRDVTALDADFVDYYGQDALERLGLLFILSDLHFQAGAIEAATRADVLIARIAAKHMDEAAEDLLWAVRNLAIAFDSDGADIRSAVAFAALFEFYAVDLLGFDDPMAQEATAMSAIALLRTGQDKRAAQKFFLYSFEDWEAFAAIGPDEESIAIRLIQELDALPIKDQDAWMAEVQTVQDAYLIREALSREIGDLVVEAQLDFASPHYRDALEKMKEYILIAHPEDPVTASYLGMILRNHLHIGDYGGAIPYLAGLLEYPAAYVAVLDLPLGQLAGTFALRGGVDDTLFEPLLERAQELERLVPGEDADLAFDLTFALAQIKERQGRLDDALADYVTAIDLGARDGVRPGLVERALNGAASASADLGDFNGAGQFARRMLDSAIGTEDEGAISAAYTLLSRAALGLGENGKALDYARQKLTFEEARAEPDREGIRNAQINLAVQLLASDEVSPELAALLPRIFEGAPLSPEEKELRVALMEAVAARLRVTPETIEDSAIFAASSPAGRADLVAFLAEAAAQEGDLETALNWMIFSRDLAVSPSSAFFRLTQLEGDLALVLEEEAQALAALRTITKLRLSSPALDETGALDHIPLHITAAARLSRIEAGETRKRLQDEVFRLAQQVSTTRAGQSLTAALLRDQSDDVLRDLLRQRTVIDTSLTDLATSIAQARYDGRSANALRDRESALLAERTALSARIATIAPELAEISRTDPLGIDNLAGVLQSDEVMILYATSDTRLADGSATSHMVAISRDAIEVAALPPRAELRALADGLRCSAALTDPGCGQGGGATRGKFSLTGPSEPTGPAFDTALAHQAYRVVLGPVAGMLDGKKRIVIVPDAALATLPLHLMLSEPPAAGQPLRQAPWLIRAHSIEIAPTVAGFVSLRASKNRAGSQRAFLGIGDPLIGVQRTGPVDYPCRGQDADDLILATYIPPDLQRATGTERISLVADLSALPDTRCELGRIATRFEDSALLLHDKATEANIKGMSEAGQLRSFSVLNFATHGLIAGEIGINDAGLVLTPPEVATARDDGLLTTSEIATLDLDADFVILSACNTASGDNRSNEGLSGLASAFFAAGARSLLVSHWPVYSDAAVDLTTRTFDNLASSPDMPRAEAVRQAMLSILDDPSADARMQHPAYWGPFMVVGDGLGSARDQ